MIEVDGYRIEPLTTATWPAFEALVERQSSLFRGCWCTNFHCYPDPPERKEIGNRAFKQQLVEHGRAHAALVFDGDDAVAWAQFGSVEELGNIHHRKEWERSAEQVPDYRITCVLVDRGHRRAGLASSRTRTTSRPTRRCRRRSSTTRPARCTSASASPTTGRRARATA